MEILKILMCSNWMQNGNLLCLLNARAYESKAYEWPASPVGRSNRPRGVYFCWIDFLLFVHILLKTEYRKTPPPSHNQTTFNCCCSKHSSVVVITALVHAHPRRQPTWFRPYMASFRVTWVCFLTKNSNKKAVLPGLLGEQSSWCLVKHIGNTQTSFQLPQSSLLNPSL